MTSLLFQLFICLFYYDVIMIPRSPPYTTDRFSRFRNWLNLYVCWFWSIHDAAVNGQEWHCCRLSVWSLLLSFCFSVTAPFLTIYDNVMNASKPTNTRIWQFPNHEKKIHEVLLIQKFQSKLNLWQFNNGTSFLWNIYKFISCIFAPLLTSNFASFLSFFYSKSYRVCLLVWAVNSILNKIASYIVSLK